MHNEKFVFASLLSGDAHLGIIYLWIDCFLKELLRKVGRQSFFQLTNTASVKAQYLGEYWELHAL